MAKSKHNVNVVVKARDEASRKFKHIGSSAMNMGSMLKKAAAAAAVYFSTRELIRFARSSVEASMEQEKADELLAQSLRNVGAATRETYKDLKDYASEIQRLTVYGDESTEQLMSLGLTLGVTTDKLKEATKGAIGLSAATGGKMGLSDAMKNVALAFQGEYTMLNRYIPALRAAKTETEKMAILQETMADGFKLAEINARKGMGPITQMKNAIGDVKEVIGNALLPIVQESATKIKEWAENNQQKIGEWAQKTVAYVTFGKNILMDFIRYLRTDWKQGFLYAYNVAANTFEAIGKVMVVTMRKAMGEMSYMLFKTFRGLYASSDTTFGKKIYAGLGKTFGKIWSKLEDENMKAGENIQKIRDDLMGAIISDAPKPLLQDFEKSWAKLQARLQGIASPTGPQLPGVNTLPGMSGGSGLSLAAQKQSLSARESRFMTYTGGSKATTPEERTAKQAEKQTGILQKIEKHLAGDNREGMDKLMSFKMVTI